jgi:hypothetical protein
MPLRQQKYKKHILGFSQKHAYANKKALITFASKTAMLLNYHLSSASHKHK